MKKLKLSIFCSILTLSLCGVTLARPKEYRKLIQSGTESVPNENRMMSVGGEPTCEELRVMWRFSRRQSRAAEITNEIPTYKDPFAYNIWEPYPKVRSVLGYPRRSRLWSKPVFGRIVQYPPKNHPRTVPAEAKAYDEMLRVMELEKLNEEQRKKASTLGPTHRLSGGQAPGNRLYESGSFQRLKELIWAERIKELHQQRLLEEASSKSTAENNAQLYNDNSRRQNNIYKYIDQEAKAARRRLLNGEVDMDSTYVPDMYMGPYHQKVVFNSESSNEKIW